MTKDDGERRDRYLQWLYGCAVCHWGGEAGAVIVRDTFRCPSCDSADVRRIQAAGSASVQ